MAIDGGGDDGLLEPEILEFTKGIKVHPIKRYHIGSCRTCMLQIRLQFAIRWTNSPARMTNPAAPSPPAATVWSTATMSPTSSIVPTKEAEEETFRKNLTRGETTEVGLN